MCADQTVDSRAVNEVIAGAYALMDSANMPTNRRRSVQRGARQNRTTHGNGLALSPEAERLVNQMHRDIHNTRSDSDPQIEGNAASAPIAEGNDIDIDEGNECNVIDIDEDNDVGAVTTDADQCDIVEIPDVPDEVCATPPRRRRLDNVIPIATIDLCSGVPRATVRAGNYEVVDLVSPQVKNPPKYGSANVQGDTSSEHQCSICLENYKSREPTVTNCGHMFCKGCIMQAIQLTHKCPLCKSKINPRNLIRVYL